MVLLKNTPKPINHKGEKQLFIYNSIQQESENKNLYLKPGIVVHRRQRQVVDLCEFKTSLVYGVKPCNKQLSTSKWQEKKQTKPKPKPGSGEIVQGLRAFAALAKDLSLVLSIYIRHLTCAYDSSSWESSASRGACTHVYILLNTKFNKSSKSGKESCTGVQEKAQSGKCLPCKQEKLSAT